MSLTTESTAPPRARLERLDENLLTVTAHGDARLTIVRLADARLILFGAIALDATELRALEKFGTPAYLIVPSEAHLAAAQALKARYPEITVVATAGVREQLTGVLDVDQTSIELGDTSVCFVTIPGTSAAEAALIIATASGVTLVVDDLILKMPEPAGFGRWALKTDAGASRESLLPAPPFFKTAADRESLRAQLLAWAQIDGLNRIIVSRGDNLTQDVPHALIDVAATLAG